MANAEPDRSDRFPRVSSASPPILKPVAVPTPPPVRSWRFWAVTASLGALVVAGASAGATWLLVAGKDEAPSGGARARPALGSAVDAAGAVTPTVPLAAASSLCTKLAVCCRKLALRGSGKPGNCDGFLQLADHACRQPLESFRSSASALGMRCD